MILSVGMSNNGLFFTPNLADAEDDLGNFAPVIMSSNERALLTVQSQSGMLMSHLIGRYRSFINLFSNDLLGEILFLI